MPGFNKGGTLRAPFGKNVYLRSTQGLNFESYTCSAAAVTSETIDNFTNQKVLQPGTVMAKITFGSEIGKVGPFCNATGTNAVQTLTPTGTISGGTFNLVYAAGTTVALAFNATAATIQAALETIFGVGNVTATGGPISTTPVVVTFAGVQGGKVQALPTVTNNLTGTAPVITPTTTTPGVAGATDGRQTAANIVGLNDTFLPWQLVERDVEVAVAYRGVAVQAWCFEYDLNGLRAALSNGTAGAMFALKPLDINFK